MSEPDTKLFNEVKGTMHLINRARYWERLADDARLPVLVRLGCWEDAQAIRKEMRP